MIKPKKKTKKEIELEFMDSMYHLIQIKPPQGFHIEGFKLLTISGRIEEATQMINKYIEEQNAREKN